MKRSIRWLVTVALGLFILFAVPGEPRTAAGEQEMLVGFASAYAPGRMAEVIRYRLDHDLWRVPPPRGWYEAHGAIATNDCAQVGEMATLIDPGGREYPVLVADCGGDDGGAVWMADNNIIAELDWNLWLRLTGEHGRPLEVMLR